MSIDYSNPPHGLFCFATQTWFDQLDGQMVLHHPRYFVLVERAQQAWIEEVLGAPRFDWRNFPDMYLVVRRLEAEYERAVDGVMDLLVTLRCLELRAATMTVGFELRSRDGSTLFCRGIRQNCKVDRASHEPRLWSDAFAEKFAVLASAAKELPDAATFGRRRRR